MFSTTASLKKVFAGNSNNDPQPEIAAEAGDTGTYISETFKLWEIALKFQRQIWGLWPCRARRRCPTTENRNMAAKKPEIHLRNYDSVDNLFQQQFWGFRRHRDQRNCPQVIVAMTNKRKWKYRRLGTNVDILAVRRYRNHFDTLLSSSWWSKIQNFPFRFWRPYRYSDCSLLQSLGDTFSSSTLS